MRRSEREIRDITEILGVIESCPVVRLGLADGLEPYVVPLNFGYTHEGGRLALFFHSALEGRKVDMLIKNPRVCFEMDRMRGIVKNESACSWSTEYESVIGYGMVSVVNDPSEKKAAMNVIMKRYGLKEPPEYNPDAFERTFLYRLDAESFTGKRNAAKR